MTYKIVADSSSNVWTLPDIDYTAVPLTIRTDEKEYTDSEHFPAAEMIEELRVYKGKSSTACPSIGDWTEAFGEADRVFAVTLSNNISGSYNAASQAALQYMDENPDKKVYIVDSLSAGPELELLVEKLRELILTKHEFEDICRKIEEYKQHTHTLFCLESVTNFARNGRINPAIAKVVGLLGIRIIGRASSVGTLETLHKCRGEKASLAKLWETMKTMGFAGAKVRIAHCFNKEAAESLKAAIVSAFPKSNIKICPCSGLCCYYAEQGGVLVAFESGMA